MPNNTIYSSLIISLQSTVRVLDFVLFSVKEVWKIPSLFQPNLESDARSKGEVSSQLRFQL